MATGSTNPPGRMNSSSSQAPCQGIVSYVNGPELTCSSAEAVRFGVTRPILL